MYKCLLFFFFFYQRTVCLAMFTFIHSLLCKHSVIYALFKILGGIDWGGMGIDWGWDGSVVRWGGVG